jgi:hypothetical protein
MATGLIPVVLQRGGLAISPGPVLALFRVIVGATALVASALALASASELVAVFPW